MPKPKVASNPNNDMEDIIAEARPTSSEEKSRATIIQKIKPRPEIPRVLIIRYEAFL